MGIGGKIKTRQYIFLLKMYSPKIQKIQEKNKRGNNLRNCFSSDGNIEIKKIIILMAT